MIRPISVASDGYLSLTKRVLIIAVAGYLNFGGTPPTPTPDQIFPGGGGGSLSADRDERLSDENGILVIIKAFLECH